MKSNWKTKKLGEIFDLRNGRGFKKTEWADHGLPIIRIQNLNDPNAEFNYFLGNYSPEIEINAGDLLFSWSGTVGSSFGPHIWHRQKGLLNQHIFKINFKQDMDRMYAFYSLKYITTDVEKRVNGSVGLVHITKEKLKEFIITTPPISEQQRIVAILDKVLAGIEKAKENTKKNLQNAKELFELYLENTFTAIAQEYGEKKLETVCNRVEYGSAAKSRKEGKIPVLRMGNIQNGRFTWDNLVYSDNDEEIAKYLLKYNDVLFNRTNSPELVGKTAIYKGERPAIFAGYLIRIHRKDDLLDGDYLNYFLNCNIAKAHGKTVVISSVNQANINGKKLKDYQLPVPSLKEQQRIVTAFNTLSIKTRKLEVIYQQKLLDLEELKKSVLQKAFSGGL